MEFDTLSRTVRLSVGELANFRNLPRSGSGASGKWRARLGQQWHKESARQTSVEHPEARFEQTIAGRLLHKDWTFELQGRIDEILPRSGSVTLREVKTVRDVLPCPPEDLIQDYPEYFAQAAIYKRLADLLPEYSGQAVQSELVFIEINTGTVQVVPLDEWAEQIVERQLDQLTTFLDDRRMRRVQLSQLVVRPAFTELREGQAELIGQLDEAALKSPNILLQAPTGFGKTSIALEHALRRMQDGVFERCIYLTSKSSGQLQTVRQLDDILGDGLRYIQMRNRTEHMIESLAHSCTGDSRCDDDLELRWQKADIHPPDLLREGTLRLEDARALGRETGVCPYALTKACLPFAELWIGDSNYLFSPQSRHVFLETCGFDPARTILIIDEAHNLPARNADALSIEMNGHDLYFALEELREAGASSRLLRSLEQIANELSRQSADTVPELEQIYLLSDLCQAAAGFLEESRFDYGAVTPRLLDLVWRIPDLASRLDELPEAWLHWYPASGVFRAQCLDASRWTADCLKPFSSTLLMSATLDPLEMFQNEIGLKPEQTSLAVGWADWREQAYDVAIDCRVDTRMKERERHYETTARTIARMVEADPGQPVVAFFPSYQYAENISAYLSAVDDSIRVALQPRGVSLDEQSQFIDEGLLMADVLFLIIGSSYAEGIDKLGGRVRSVIVVGPALPEVNAVQKAKMATLAHLSREAAFEKVYLIPAMRRIHQALGRMVRAPGQNARVLLHCKRFAQKTYNDKLQAEYQSRLTIRSEASLFDWLNSTS